MVREDILSSRERNVLQAVINKYIITAEPVGSRSLVNKYNLGISAATIRNTMTDLEERGYLKQPHTSAGRVPTDKGYRCYVDHLMQRESLNETETTAITKSIQLTNQNIEKLLDQTSKTLSVVSKLLGITLIPCSTRGVFHRLEIIPLLTKRFLLMVTLESGIVKSKVVEIDSEVPTEDFDEAAKILNEHLVGLTLTEIRNSIKMHIGYGATGYPRLIRFFIDTADQLFDFHETEELHFGGANNIFEQPEFDDKRKMSTLIKVIEEKEPIASILESRGLKKGVFITIGRENRYKEIEFCSIVTSDFQLGALRGILGVIGPTRMRYSKIVSLVDYVAKLLGNLFA